MKFREYFGPDEYWFTKDHTWLFIKDKVRVRIGIASTLLKMLGPLKNIELPNLGDKVFRAQRMGCLETLKTRVDLFSPITGNVESVNQAVLSDLSVIHYDPYGEGQLLEVGPSSLVSVRNMSSETATERTPVSLGIYSSFPTLIHGHVILTHDVNVKVLQECVIQAISKVNMQNIQTTLSVADRSGYFAGETRFEVRIAEGSSFRNLNPTMKRRLIEYLRFRGEFSTFDYSLTIRYRIKDDMRHSLHCDKYVVRHLFFEDQMEIQLFHEKGIRRLNPDEVITMLVKRINNELGKRDERQLKIEKMRVV